MRQAQALDPLDPLYLTWLAEMCTELERHDEALELTRRALDMNPDYVSASVIQVLALRGKGMHQDAIDLATKLAAKEAWTKPVLARALIGAGRLAEATRLVAEVRTLPPDVVGAWHVLNAYVELGDNANAIAWIETMIARQHIFCSWIDAHLALSRANDALRADPRYKAAMAKIKPSV
jgi:tetratricopeptide (TPR) repeat protein